MELAHHQILVFVMLDGRVLLAAKELEVEVVLTLFQVDKIFHLESIKELHQSIVNLQMETPNLIATETLH